MEIRIVSSDRLRPFAPPARAAFVVSPRRILSDVLSKGWIEGAIPFIAFIALAIGVLIFSNGYVSAANARNLAQFAADGALVTLALLIVVAAGGIDFRSAPIRDVGVRCALRLPRSGSAGLGSLLRQPWLRRFYRRRQRGACRIAGLRRAADDDRHDDHRARTVHSGLSGTGPISISPRSDDLWDWIGAEKPLGMRSASGSSPLSRR